jgi:hypothetical protein
MKKLVAVSILLTLLSVAAFAQFTVGVTADFYPDLLKATGPTGDGTDNLSPIYQGVGTFDLFSTSDTWVGSELRLGLGYTEPGEARYGATLQFKMDELVRRNIFFQGTDSYLSDGDPAASLLDWVQAPFGDWNVWGKVGILKGYVGNTADRGIAGNMRYNDATITAFFDDIKMDNYGIIMPAFMVPDANIPNLVHTVQYGYRDVFNLKTFPTAPGNVGGRPYFSLTADLAPLQIAVAGDLGPEDAYTTGAQDPLGYNKVGAAVRVSGADIADLLSFDVIYKIRGGDPTAEEDNSQVEQPDARGLWGHNFGAVVNLSLIDSLGIGVGYSGYAYAQEKRDNPNAQRFIYPYYNGIDLRFNFTGVDKLTVNFNNNISFATINGDDNTDTTINGGFGGLAPNGDLQEDQSAGYLSLYNALGFKYQVTEDLYGSLQLMNTLSSGTYTDQNDNKTVVSGDVFRAILGAGYSIGKVALETGLAFNFENGSYDMPSGGGANYNGGAFTFAIPIHFSVALP